MIELFENIRIWATAVALCAFAVYMVGMVPVMVKSLLEPTKTPQWLGGVLRVGVIAAAIGIIAAFIQIFITP